MITKLMVSFIGSFGHIVILSHNRFDFVDMWFLNTNLNNIYLINTYFERKMKVKLLYAYNVIGKTAVFWLCML